MALPEIGTKVEMFGANATATGEVVGHGTMKPHWSVDSNVVHVALVRLNVEDQGWVENTGFSHNLYATVIPVTEANLMWEGK